MLDLEVEKLFRSEVEGGNYRLQTFPKVRGQTRIFQGGEFSTKVQRDLCFGAGQDYGARFLRSFEPKTRVEGEAVKPSLAEVETTASRPTGFNAGGRVEGQKDLRKQRPFANAVEQLSVFWLGE